MQPTFAVHGGAWNIPDELWPAHQEGCRRAHALGLGILEAGGSALEAVVAAIRVLEDDPTYDAGFGSFLNRAGQVELDAGLMEGRTLRSGAVLGVSRVRNPIDLAHYVLHHTDHCVFTAEGAHALAPAAGLAYVDPASHVHPREAETHRRIRAGEQSILDSAWHQPGDTVGAIALDRHGDLACGNSTGGTLQKAVGRVGDAPLIGIGFYADNHLGAAVCTGWGESIMRSAMALQALTRLDALGAQGAAQWAIDHLERRVGGYGGILIMAPDGTVGMAHNTPRMASCNIGISGS